MSSLRDALDLYRVKAEEILDYLETGALEGMDSPFWRRLICYRILLASEEPHAPEILASLGLETSDSGLDGSGVG